MTGATFSTALLGAKRLGILRDLVPSAKVIALLVNQSSSQGQRQKQDVEEAASEVGHALSFWTAARTKKSTYPMPTLPSKMSMH